ncbi:MAG: hypothetical protein HY918_01070 [Candidatus Doudnabacteria bacterium]|nr:hypothetical protein [Candidatus Doudnabacteria bacterium]
MNKAIITAASNKFFPSLINLLGSIKANYPNHPKIFVYDLGLFWSYREELKKIENVEVLPMPKFCRHWRQCYTWKTYIFYKPLARLNFYIDAGSQVLYPLDEVFEFIERDDYFAVSQVLPLNMITPIEYRRIFSISEEYYSKECVTAGIFGFKENSKVTPILNELYDAAVCGLCLGLSPRDSYRNKGPHKSDFVRNCELFRQDTTLLSLILRKYLNNFIIHDINRYAAISLDKQGQKQLIWNVRMNYLTLNYLNTKFLHRKSSLILYLNRLIVRTFLFLRVIKLYLQGNAKKIKSLQN